MDNSDRDSKPLGPSVEQIEADEGNRTNPSVPGEAMRQEDALPPIPAMGSSEGSPMAARGTVSPLLGDARGADTHADRADTERDSSEEG